MMTLHRRLSAQLNVSNLSKPTPTPGKIPQALLASVIGSATGTDVPFNSNNDEIIAVMGITGVGKTTFIEHLTKLGLKIGKGLESCKRSCSAFCFSVTL
jgi:ABC-type multidrug transport system ATPase subunit